MGTMRYVLAGLALALAPAGCGGGPTTDIDQTLVFADRSDTEIARLINAATGAEMFQAQAQVNQFADTTDPCPQLAISGKTATITGGCTTADGLEIQGSAVVTNPVGWDQIDTSFGDAQDYELDGLAFVQQGFTQSYDGVMHVSGDFTDYSADLVTTSAGVALRSDLNYSCGGTSCSLEGSGVELLGVGGAHVSGTVRVRGDVGATFTLRGVDTLRATITQGCVAWQIDSTERAKICP